MKKKVRLFLMTFLLAASSVLPVCAAGNADSLPAPHVTYALKSYEYTYNNMKCICYINTVRSVTAGTAMDGQTVTIKSDSYAANGNNNGNGGNAGGGSTTTNYSASSDIDHVVSTHSAPNLNISVTYTLYR